MMMEKGSNRREPARFFSVIRPAKYNAVVKAHLPYTLITGLVLIMTHLVPIRWLPPHICLFLWLTGYPCVFCGFTRSIWALPQGDWAFAVSNCPLAVLLYIAILLVFAWNGAGLLCGVRIRRGRYLRLDAKQFRVLIIATGVLFLSNWVYRILSGLK